MQTQFCNDYKLALRNWGVSLVLGIIFMGLAMINPINNILLSTFMFICGGLQFTFFVFNRYTSPCWHWYIVGEVIDFDEYIIYVIEPPESAYITSTTVTSQFEKSILTTLKT